MPLIGVGEQLEVSAQRVPRYSLRVDVDQVTMTSTDRQSAPVHWSGGRIHPGMVVLTPSICRLKVKYFSSPCLSICVET